MEPGLLGSQCPITPPCTHSGNLTFIPTSPLPKGHSWGGCPSSRDMSMNSNWEKWARAARRGI